MGTTNHDRLTKEEKEKALELARAAGHDRGRSYSDYLMKYIPKDRAEICRYVNPRMRGAK